MTWTRAETAVGTSGRATAGRATDDMRRAARDDAVGHSRRVRRLKVAIPVFGVLIVAVIAAWVAITSWAPGISVASALLTGEGLTMVEPRLRGTHDKRSYDVTAERAFQSLDNPKLVRFVNITGSIEVEPGNFARLVAARGAYQTDSQALRLEKDVTITTADGYRIELENADADLEGNNITTSGAVRITRTGLSIEAVGGRMMGNGEVVVLESKVKVVMVPAPDAPGASSPSNLAPASSPANPAPPPTPADTAPVRSVGPQAAAPAPAPAGLKPSLPAVATPVAAPAPAAPPKRN